MRDFHKDISVRSANQCLLQRLHGIQQVLVSRSRENLSLVSGLRSGERTHPFHHRREPQRAHGWDERARRRCRRRDPVEAMASLLHRLSPGGHTSSLDPAPESLPVMEELTGLQQSSP